MKSILLSAMAIGVFALTASAQNYKVVVTTSDGQKTEYETSNLSSIKFENAPDYHQANYLLGAQYTSKNEMGIYYISFGTSAPDEGGDPAKPGDMQLAVELTADLSEDHLNAVLPAGYYRIGNGTNKGEINLQNSGLWIRVEEGSDGVTGSPIVDGTIDVRYSNSEYDIRCELTLLSGEFVALSYSGPIKFVAGISESGDFTKDQNVTFTGAQARYYANWFYPLADDITLELYSGEFIDGKQSEGYWMNIPLYLPKAADPKNPSQFVADGVYTVDVRESVLYNTNLPFTYDRGKLTDLFGQLYNTGTYVTYLDKTGSVQRGFVVDGTITISDNATKVVVDVVTDKGIKISGTYSGNIIIDNRNDSENAPKIEGTIDADLALDFNSTEETTYVAVAYSMGNYIKEDVTQYALFVMDQEQAHGDCLTFELCTDGNAIADGTYTINNDVAPFGGLKGFVDTGGNIMFSWYGDLDSTDPDGYQTVMAPIMGGTVTISTLDDGNRKMVFDLVDEDGHKIAGTFEGLFVDATEEVEPTNVRKLKLPTARR